MRRGPKPHYCYVCQKDLPCGPLDPCNTLPKDQKAIAYQIGYQKKNKESLNQRMARHYRISHPKAEPYKPQDQRSLEKSLRPQRKTRDQVTEESKLRTLIYGDKNTRKKRAAALKRDANPKRGRRKADQEAD